MEWLVKQCLRELLIKYQWKYELPIVVGYILTFIAYVIDLILFIRRAILPSNDPFSHYLEYDLANFQLFPWYELFTGSDWSAVGLMSFGSFFVCWFFVIFSVVVLHVVNNLLGIEN